MTDRCAECGGIVHTDPGDSFSTAPDGIIHDECLEIRNRRRQDFLFAGTPEFTETLTHQMKGNENE